jgi:hypothetical protein
MTINRRNRVTRQTQEPDTFYVCPDGAVFLTPDGEGRYWYDSLREAQEDLGDIWPVVHLSETPED